MEPTDESTQDFDSAFKTLCQDLSANTIPTTDLRRIFQMLYDANYITQGDLEKLTDDLNALMTSEGKQEVCKRVHEALADFRLEKLEKMVEKEEEDEDRPPISQRKQRSGGDKEVCMTEQEYLFAIATAQITAETKVLKRKPTRAQFKIMVNERLSELRQKRDPFHQGHYYYADPVISSEDEDIFSAG
jgi:hypothetical protein